MIEVAGRILDVVRQASDALSVAEVARRANLDPRTVAKYADLIRELTEDRVVVFELGNTTVIAKGRILARQEASDGVSLPRSLRFDVDLRALSRIGDWNGLRKKVREVVAEMFPGDENQQRVAFGYIYAYLFSAHAHDMGMMYAAATFARD